MSKIQKIRVLEFAKFQAKLVGLMGFVLGVIYSFGGLLIDSLVTLGWFTSNETTGLSLGSLLAFGALIVMPIIGVVGGFLLGLLEGATYLLFKKWLGKVSLDFRVNEPDKKNPK